MDYREARLKYDQASDELQVAFREFDGLFPPRNTPIHLRTPALNHDRVNSLHQQLDRALAAYGAAVSSLVEVAKRECPDVYVHDSPPEDVEL